MPRLARRLGLAVWLLASNLSYAATDDPVELTPIQVSATLTAQPWLSSPVPITVLTHQQMQAAVAHATPDLFAQAAGVYMQKTNLGGGSPFLRGLTGKHVLLLIDGLRLNNSYYRSGPHQYLNTIDPESIERIEVIRGPGSVLYGSDALGGVINIITKTAAPQPGGWNGQLVLHGDSATSGAAASLRLEHGGSALRSWGGLRGKTLDDLDVGGDAPDEVPSGYDEVSGDFAIRLPTGEQSDFTLGASYLQAFDVPKTSEVTLGSKSQFNYEPQVRSQLRGDYEIRNWGPFTRALTQFSLSYQKEGEDVISRAAPDQRTVETVAVLTPGIQLQFESQLQDKHQLVFGVQAYRDTYDTQKYVLAAGTGRTLASPGTPDGAHYLSLGAFIQHQAMLGEHLWGLLGLRYSSIDTEGEVGNETLDLQTDALTAAGSLNWALNEQAQLVLRVAQGFRAPNMEDFFGKVDFFSEVPNTSLKPEKSLNWDLGLRVDSPRLSGELFVYLADYTDLIDRVTVGTQSNGDPIKQRRNVAEARIQGVEAAMDYTLDTHWTLGMSATYTYAEDEDGQGLRRIPPLNGSISLRYSPRPQWSAELLTIWADAQDRLSGGDIDDARIPAGGTPGYGVVHLRGSWQHGGSRVGLALENLADKAYKTHGSGLLAPGRSIRLGYRYEF